MQLMQNPDPMTQSESNVQSFQKIWTLSYHLGHGQLFLQTSRMYGYGQERKRSRDLDKTLRWGFGFRLFSSSICLSFTISPRVLHQRNRPPPPHFFRNDLPLRIEMQWKVQDWNRDFFFTKNYQNAEDPICKHAACSYGEVIDSLSVVVPAPHKLLPENEEVTAMPLEDLEGGWLLVLFFSCLFGGLLRVCTPKFLWGPGFVSNPKGHGVWSKRIN